MTTAGTPRRGSLRRRLVVGLTLGITGLWLLGALIAGWLLAREIDEVFDSALQEVAQRILPLAYSEVLSRDGDATTQHMPPVAAHRETITYVVRDPAGRALLQSSDADAMQIPQALPPGFHTTARLRTYTETAVRGTLVITAAEDLAHRRAAVMRSLAALVWPLALLVPVSAAGIWLAVRLALRPVVAFRAALELRGRGNLSPVMADAVPDEIGPLADAVNDLITRLRGALEAERSFTANSAHELRTPIAAALAQAQRLTSELRDEVHRKRALAIVTSLRRLSRLSEKLLQLAKAEGGGLIAPSAAPLAPVLALIVDETRRETSEASRLELFTSPDGAPSDLDPDAFAILARNLIENALRHGDRQAPVSVVLRSGLLEVTNRGPVVPSDRLAVMTRPFERGPTKAEGSGLGLAIVSSICRGAGLELTLSSPIPGEVDGFRAAVRLPAPAPATVWPKA